MQQRPQAVGARPTFPCYKCKRTAITLLLIPGRAAICLPCLHQSADSDYQAISTWVTDHKPLDKPPSPPAI